ncbi:Uncharacterised protein [uncultured archaeon]|nr:Uncharacterised protein [uncultured archaeon]
MGIEKLAEKEKEILFSDFPETKEFERKTYEKYSANARDIRNSTGRFYTPKEMKERAKKAFSVKLY